MPAPQMIDWDVAVATARRLMRPGPQVSPQEAREVVAELRGLVPTAEQHVRDYTHLVNHAADGGAVAVVDRIGWVQANLDGFKFVLEPLAEKLTERRGAPSGLAAVVGPKVTGAQVGTVLSYLASRVLGQYELFIPAEDGAGRLTLVAPNIVDVERELGVDPHDFRLWVTLHEVTHRTQFTAVPWLRSYFTGEVRAFVLASDLDPQELFTRLKDAATAVRAARSGADDSPSVIEALQTPEQREILGRLQALMSLLEGHGDFVMDGVGPAVVPTAALIRRRFDQRRKGAGPLDRLVRKLLGLDLKMKQYADGEKFVHHVVDAVGMTGFNRVWTSPETLPTSEEIKHPQAWVDRVRPAAPVGQLTADDREAAGDAGA
ncbi:MAG TPA: zinc-dependent metalloprotease [Mycobacteriales bacterium]|nr:zinc-dependent metalloprotease [Mycobacteriales bacterium]